ncbi:MAG TPA: DUF4395 domain-containing protein, partial [Candidatus Angelobacter sp.]|nr:DUF4395 domain-containing protein [Candidatus Angelobacter sp.]
FGAGVTTVVLALTLVTVPTTLSLVLLAAQTLVFALGAVVGVQAQPYGVLFRTMVRPRLAPATRWEDAAPPRFAQTVGLGFALVGLLGLVSGAAVVAYVAIGLALAAAFLNAAFDFCLGCEMYLLGRRLLAGRAA